MSDVEWEAHPLRRERQIAFVVSQDIVVRASALLGKTTTPAADAVILNSMLAEAQSIQKNWSVRKENGNGGEEVDDLITLLRQQFDLSAPTRRSLAAERRPLPSRLIVETDDDANDIFHTIARLMATYASLWVATGLGLIGLTKAGVAHIQETVNFFADSIHDFRRRKRHIKATRPGERAKEDAGRLLHMDLLDKKFCDGSLRYAAAPIPGCETALQAGGVAIICLPLQQRVQLADLLAVFRRDFKLPPQLRETAKFFEGELKAPGRFGRVVNKIDEYEAEARSMVGVMLAVDYVFRNASQLVQLYWDLEGMIKPPQQQKKIWVPMKRKEVRVTQNASVGSSAEEESAGQRQVVPPIYENEIIPIREVVAGRWVLKTRLDDVGLDTRLVNEQDESTFQDPRQCAGYHIQKHAKGYLVETYLKEGLKLHKNHWTGEVCPRIAGSPDDSGGEWVMRVRCAAGRGCFSYDGSQVKVVWYEPPRISD